VRHSLTASGALFQFEHRQSVDELPAYKALCHGLPLHGEAIYKATREGYVVHPSFGCITKVSFEANTRLTVNGESLLGAAR
jgi:hypothetical protein